VHAGANRLSVSPSGRWVLVWSDASLIQNADPTEGLQDVTVLDLSESPPATRRLTVGYRPSRVVLGDDDRHAYVVSEPSVSVLDLPRRGRPNVMRDVSLSSDPAESASSRDVTVTPDGAFALVRRLDHPVVELVALDGSGTTRITLPGAVTDLDLSPDGALAFAVVRGGKPVEMPGAGGSGGGNGQGGNGNADPLGSAGAEQAGAGGEEAGGAPGTAGTGGSAGTAGSGGTTTTVSDSFVAVLPIPAIVEDPAAFTLLRVARVVGSVVVAREGSVALLYTNAVDDGRITILDYGASPPKQRTVNVQAPVKAVLPSPDGAHAVALLGKATNSTKPGGFSLIPVRENLPPKIVGAEAPPVAVAVGNDAALVTITNGTATTNGTVNGAYLGRLPELSTELVSLGSTPLSAALVPDAGIGFVAQRHPEGRITFIDLESGTPRTLTGFELTKGVTSQ
jgi:hypothetical protein